MKTEQVIIHSDSLLQTQCTGKPSSNKDYTPTTNAHTQHSAEVKVQFANSNVNKHIIMETKQFEAVSCDGQT